MSEERKSRRAKVKNVFEEEIVILKNSRLFLEKEDISLDECKHQLTLMQTGYDDLLDQTKLITKVSDRLQKKINKTNDQLESKNVELQDTLDALSKAKVSRKANSITLIVVIALFLITEAFIEPGIETYAEENYHDIFDNAPMVFSLLAKVIIALSLRPIEKIVEKRLMKREADKIQAETKLQKKAKLQ